MNYSEVGLSDKIGIKDEIFISKNGEAFFDIGKMNNKMKIVGEITVKEGLTGKTLYTFNDVIIPGATYIIEKFFNRRSTFGMTTLSTDLNVNAGTPLQDNLKEELVFGFIVGIGGNTPPDLINAVKFKDKSVASIVPMRVVDITADLSPEDQLRYAIKKTIGSKYYYYAKRFDQDVIIRHLYTDGTEIPINVDQVDTTLGMLVFGEAVFTVSANDLREYFMLTYGNIDTCRFNSIGLVAGFVDNGDYAGVRCTTKANLPNLYLRDAESYYTFTYKVYAI